MRTSGEGDQMSGFGNVEDFYPESPERNPEGLDFLKSLDWDFSGEDTSEHGHSIYPYPCKFPPQIPRRLIGALSSPGDLILDCFGGSGTTALEAIRLGRSSLSVDANPLSVLLTRVKTTPFSAANRKEASRIGGSIIAEATHCIDAVNCAPLKSAPTFANQAKWFSPNAFHELSHLRHGTDQVTGHVRDLLDLALTQTATRISFQESETRYVSKFRTVSDGETYELFAKEVARILRRLPLQQFESDSVVALGDARDRSAYHVEDESVQLLVSSPPYPNAYDYHLYHRFRLLWLREQPAELRRVEIGSHLRQQTLTDPVGDYERDMTEVLKAVETLIRPGGYCVFVVGDGLYRGETYRTSHNLLRIAESSGFKSEGVISRRLPVHSRSVTSAGRRLKSEELVLLSKPVLPLRLPTRYHAFDYEEKLARRELKALATADRSDSQAFERLAFSTGVITQSGEVSTWQNYLEADRASKRKNSTYATHGIHRYKGKFYPQLAKCLINMSAIGDGIVVDPFAGSGTVALEAALQGISSHAIEINPAGTAISRAKVESLFVPGSVFDKVGHQLEISLRSRSRSCDWSQFEESVHDELKSWFSPLVLTRISRVLKALRTSVDEVHSTHGSSVRLLGEVILSDLIRDVSHQEPSDLRIRRRAEPLSDADVEGKFLAKWNLTIDRMNHVRGGRVFGLPDPRPATIRNGDSCSIENWPTNAAAMISSPPYASALPYIDTDRLSLAAIFGWSKSRRADLESSLIGSREIGTRATHEWLSLLESRSLDSLLPESTVLFLTSLATAVVKDETAGFRKQQGPAVLARYFASMSQVLANTVTSIDKGGHVWLVLGDSRTTVSGVRWTIPTTTEIVEIAKVRGLELEEKIPISVTKESLRNSRNAITKNTILHFRNR